MRFYWARPDLPPVATYLAARDYIHRQENGEPVTDLDLLFAYGPDEREAWQRAVDNGWIEPEGAGFPGMDLEKGESDATSK